MIKENHFAGYCITDGKHYVSIWTEYGRDCGYYLDAPEDNKFPIFEIFKKNEDAKRVRDNQFPNCEIKKVSITKIVEIED